MSKKKCPECGDTVPKNFEFCPGCGFEIEDDDFDSLYYETDPGPTGHGDICMSDADPGL